MIHSFKAEKDMMIKITGSVQQNGAGILLLSDNAVDDLF